MDIVTVQLRHDLPDGSWHVDWMIAPDATSQLLTFRLPAPLAELSNGQPMRAERIGDHRRLYLDHEGPLPGAAPRGSVRRLSRGLVRRWVRQDGAPWQMLIDWDGSDGACRRQCLHLARVEGASWTIIEIPAQEIAASAEVPVE